MYCLLNISSATVILSHSLVKWNEKCQEVRIRNRIQTFSGIHIFWGIACHEKLSRKVLFCWNFYFRLFLYILCLSFLWEKVAKLWRGENVIKVSSSVTPIPCPIFVSGDCLTLFKMGGERGRGRKVRYQFFPYNFYRRKN